MRRGKLRQIYLHKQKTMEKEIGLKIIATFGH